MSPEHIDDGPVVIVPDAVVVVDDKAHYLLHLRAIKKDMEGDGLDASDCDEAITLIEGGVLAAKADAFTMLDGKSSAGLQAKIDATKIEVAKELSSQRPLHALIAALEDKL